VADQDTLARVIAVTGLATGVFGSVLALLAFLRDRSELSVRGIQRVEEDERLEAYVVVVSNDGRQPISVVAAGLRYQHPDVPARKGLGRVVRRALKEAGAVYVSFLEEPRFFPPGHYRPLRDERG
jgi:hypothetical protein